MPSSRANAFNQQVIGLASDVPNEPVAIRTTCDEWERVDFSGVAGTDAEATYQWLGHHAPSRELSNLTELTAFLKDWSDASPARTARAALYDADRWAAATTLPIHHGAAERFAIEAVAFRSDKPAIHHKPSWLYNLDHMVLSPVVVQPLGAARLIHLAGVVAWDKDLKVLFESEIDQQAGVVADYAHRMLHEQSASLDDLVRIRVFSFTDDAAKTLQKRLAERGMTARPVVQSFPHLREDDLRPLTMEVQFCALAGAHRQEGSWGVASHVGGVKMAWVAPLGLTGDPEQWPALMLDRLGQADVSPVHIVSLLADVPNADALPGLSTAWARLRAQGVRCGLTTCVGQRASGGEETIVVSGTSVVPR
jgi:enamine deaminase RidA (YjgF/YER057c/UK114 family)